MKDMFKNLMYVFTILAGFCLLGTQLYSTSINSEAFTSFTLIIITLDLVSIILFCIFSILERRRKNENC